MHGRNHTVKPIMCPRTDYVKDCVLPRTTTRDTLRVHNLWTEGAEVMALRERTANERLRDKRDETKKRLVDVAMELEAMLKPIGIRGVSQGSLQRYETTTPIEKMNLAVLVGLTIIYKCSPAELVPERAEEIAAYKDLLMRSSGCLTADDLGGKVLVTAAA